MNTYKAILKFENICDLFVHTHPLSLENFDKLCFVYCSSVFLVVIRHQLLHFIFARLKTQRSQSNQKISCIYTPWESKSHRLSEPSDPSQFHSKERTC
jgi:hypothetical protein